MELWVRMEQVVAEELHREPTCMGDKGQPRQQHLVHHQQVPPLRNPLLAILIPRPLLNMALLLATLKRHKTPPLVPTDLHEHTVSIYNTSPKSLHPVAKKNSQFTNGPLRPSL